MQFVLFLGSLEAGTSLPAMFDGHFLALDCAQSCGAFQRTKVTTNKIRC